LRWVRFEHEGTVSYGNWYQEGIRKIEGDPFQVWTETNQILNLEEVRLLAPTVPSKVVCLGLNYRDHAAEMQEEPPAKPIVFIKPASSVIGPNDLIQIPPQSQRVDYEAELGVVIGKTARDVNAAQAAEYILGYTCGNDVTARDLQEGQWTVAKGFDTFCPLGPAIVDGIDPTDLEVSLYLNGELRQHSTTSNLIFPVAYLVEYISKIMTLEPGDVILTGTPGGIGPMKPGDLVEVDLKGIGRLSNPVGLRS